METLPDFCQQLPQSSAPVHATHEDLVVPEGDAQHPSSSAHPQQQPQAVSAPNMVSVNPSFTSPHAFGVSFSGTANFSPLPFPPSEHPLPPPAPTRTTPLPVTPVTLASPPPYVEQQQPPQVQPIPHPHPQSPHSGSSYVYIAPLSMSVPWLPQLAPQAPPYAYGPPAMLPSMPNAPMLTPWPPVPLRNVDDFMRGSYLPGSSYAPAAAYNPSAPPHGRNTSPPTVAGSSSAPSELQYPISSARSAGTHAAQQQERTSYLQHESYAPLAPASATAASLVPTQATHPQPHSQPDSPPHGYPTSAPLEHDSHASYAPTEACAVAGCMAHVFCELAPCGCRLCRDHLGWVIRGARTVDVEAVNNDDQDTGEKDQPKHKMTKNFRCVACHTQSSMAGPPSPSNGKGKDKAGETVGLGLTNVEVPTADEVHAFSIKYFSAGPAPFAHHRSPSPVSTVGGTHDVDLSTALDPVGDASLVQHLPPAIELQPATPVAPYSLAAAQTQPHLSHLDMDFAPNRSAGAGMQNAPRPPTPPFPLGAGWPAPRFLYPSQPVPTSPGQLTPTDTVRGSSESDAGDGGARPSSAQPAPESASIASPPLVAGPNRSLSRSATSPAAITVGNPLEAALANHAHTGETGGQVPSPPESSSMSFPLRRSSLPYAPEPSFVSHRRASQSQQHEHLLAQMQGGASRFAQAGMLASAYGPVPVPVTTYAPFPPGSVSVQPHFPHLAALGHTPLGSSPRMGKKRASLPNTGAGAGGFPRWMERNAGAGAGARSGISPSATFPPRVPPSLDPHSDGAALERGKWPIVKVENIPFHTTVKDIEDWLPDGYLPPEGECIQPIHIVLHRATGRTLPHCYLEVLDIMRATDLIARMDRTQLGDRTVRVKWERAGELLRDLFSQEAYFQMGHMGAGQQVPSPAAAPLPHLPPEGFRVPDVLLTAADLGRLVQFSLRPMQFRERPYERCFFNVATLVNKFPWARKDLWDDELRDAMYETTLQVLKRALFFAMHDALFVRIAHLLVKSGKACVAFTAEQKANLAEALQEMITARPTPAASSKKPRAASLASTPTSTIPLAFAPAPASAPVPAPQTPPPAPRLHFPMTPDSPDSPPAGRAVPPHFARSRREWRRTASQDGHAKEEGREGGSVWVNATGAAGEGVEEKGWAEGSSDEEGDRGQRATAAFRVHSAHSAAGPLDEIPRPLSASAFPPLPAKPTAAIAALYTPPASPETLRGARRA